MSLVILVDLPIKPDAHDAIRAAGVKMCAATLLEEGCLRYNFSFDFADPNLVRISEEWESQEALGAHFKSPHMAEFGAAIGGLVAGAADGSKYQITSKGPVR